MPVNGRIDDLLIKLLDNGHIQLDEFLENTSMPFADKLIETRNRKLQEAQALQEQGQEADPETMALWNQMLGAA